MYNQDVLKIENLRRIKLNTFCIRWMVTNFCNYACDFCIQGSREAKKKAAQTESPETRKMVASKLAEWIEKKVSPHQIVELYLIGGEVTALQDFAQLLSTLVNCKFKGVMIFYLTTNLSRPGSYYGDLCKQFFGRNNRFLSISASFYKAYTTPEVFGNKLQGLQRFIVHQTHFFPIQRLSTRLLGRGLVPLHGRNLFLSVGWPILDDDSYQEYLIFKKKTASFGFPVNPIIMRDYPVTLSSDVQEALKSKNQSIGIRVTTVTGDRVYLRNIQQLGFMLDDVEKFCPNGYICNAGKDSFSISTDGTVMRCPSLHPLKDFYMGNIAAGTFELQKEACVCHANHCSCNYYKQIVWPKS